MNKFLKLKAAASLENMSRQMGGRGGAAGPADNMASTMGAGMGKQSLGFGDANYRIREVPAAR